MSWQFTITDYTTGGSPTVVNNPDGWAEAMLKFKRDADMHGVFTEYSFDSLKFMDDAADILELAYATAGIEANTAVSITWDCDIQQVLFSGKFNYKSYKKICDFNGGCWIEIKIEANDNIAKMRNRYDQKVDLDTNYDFAGNVNEFYPALGRDITLEPKALLKYDKMEITAESAVTDTDHFTVGGLVGHTTERFLNLPFDNIILGEFNLNGVASYTADINSFEPVAAASDGQFIVPEDGTVSGYIFELDFRVVVDGTISPALGSEINNLSIDLLFIQNTVINVEDSVSVSGTLVNTLHIDHRFTISRTKSLSIGDDCQWVLKVTANSTVSPGTYDMRLDGQVFQTVASMGANSYYYIHKLSFAPATQCRTYMINESFSRVTESITDGELRAISSYFGRTDSDPYTALTDGCGSLECLTNGLLIRRAIIQGNQPLMTLSLKDLFDSMKAIHCIGMGIEEDIDRPYFYGVPYQRIRVERFEYFYQSTVVMQCLSVPILEVTVNEGSHISTFKFGYEKYEAEEYNGIDEFLGKREYRSTLSQVKNELNATSKFVASGYAIEVTRNKDTTTKDWRFDNDVFVICVKRAYGGFVVDQGNIDHEANIIDPDSIYNFSISPLRNALRWFRYIFAQYIDLSDANSKFEFTNGTGNYFAGGQVTTGCFLEVFGQTNYENEVINLDSLDEPATGTPLWKPERVKFSYPMTAYDHNQVKANPYGMIEYSFANGAILKGWIDEINYHAEQGIADFVLIPERV